MNITAKTKLLGIFGYPIGHSLSPAMHNAAIKALGLDMAYLPFEVQPKDLKKAVDGLRGLGMIGMNITIPHKEAVIKFLDAISEEVRLIGAVNTVVNRNGRLTGYNTDGAGYIASLKESCDFNPKGKKILILGAGGAARGIIAALAKHRPQSVTIANRTRLRGISLAKEFTTRLPNVNIRAVALHRNKLMTLFEDIDLLINTTSVGMKSNVMLNIPLEALTKKAIVSDIVYNPLETMLLKAARKRGLATHNGLGMLIHQGALSFKLWTGRNPSFKVMRAAARQALRTGGGR